jgi:WD40 repeat protein
LSLWDATTGELLQQHVQTAHQDVISDLAFSNDSRILATSSIDSLVKIWEVSSGEQLAGLFIDAPANAVTLSPDAGQVVVAPRDGYIQIWDIFSITDPASADSGPQILKEPLLHLQDSRNASGVAFSPDGKRLAAIVPGQSVLVWDAQAGGQLLEIPITGDSAGISFSPQGDHLAAGSASMEVTIWNSQTGEEILILHESAPITDVRFSPSGDLLATATIDGMVTLWDANTGHLLDRLPGRQDRMNTLAFSPDGLRLAVGNEEGTTQTWDLSSSAEGELLAYKAHESEVYDAIFNPDGTRIASTGNDGMVIVRDSESGESLLSLPGRSDDVFFAAYSPDSQRLAAANAKGGVSIWDATSGQELLDLRGDTEDFTAVTFNPDGSQLAAAGQEGVGYIWDAESGRRLTVFHAESGIARLDYENDGERLWSIDRGGNAISWDAKSGAQFSVDPDPVIEHICSSPLWDAEFSLDDRYWAAAGFDNLVYVYEASDDPQYESGYSRLFSLASHASKVTGTAFNPSGTRLASASSDGKVKLWDVEAGLELLTLADLELPVQGVDFSPDGSRLITAGSDGTVSEYIISIDELMEVAQSRLSRGFTTDECRIYLHLDACPHM